MKLDLASSVVSEIVSSVWLNYGQDLKGMERRTPSTQTMCDMNFRIYYTITLKYLVYIVV